MAVGIIGDPFTFQTLFVDSAGIPVTVANAAITIFRFNPAGSRVVLVAAAAMTSVVTEVGRYTYLYEIPDTMTAGWMLYGTMTATDPGSGDILRDETAVELLLETTVTGGGLVANFVQGG